MAALQTLLAPEEPGQDRALSLSGKVSMATSALTSFPALHSLALEVVAAGVLYQCSLLDLSTSQPPPLEGGQLGVALREVWSLLESLLGYCPLGWSMRLYKVGMGLGLWVYRIGLGVGMRVTHGVN